MKKDYYSSIIEETFFELISEWRESGLSEKEISDKLNQENINQATRTLYEQASSDVLKFFVEKKFEISCKERIKSDKFIAHHNEIWGECFAVSETMYVMAVEAAEIYSKFVADTIPDEEKLDKQYTFLVLQYIHGRCCQEFLEILHLIKNGFADAAYARWRSMYELCCIACFIKKQGEVIAKQYFEQAQTNDQKYHWTKGAKNAAGKEINITTFQGIQDNCDIDESWRNQYKLSCLVLHGSPQGTFNRLCLKEDQSVIAVGQSDYGITIAAEHSAISLQWITSMFLNVFPSLDAMVYSKVIYDWVEEVRKVYFSTADICFDVNEDVEHSE